MFLWNIFISSLLLKDIFSDCVVHCFLSTHAQYYSTVFQLPLRLLGSYLIVVTTVKITAFLPSWLPLKFFPLIFGFQHLYDMFIVVSSYLGFGGHLKYVRLDVHHPIWQILCYYIFCSIISSLSPRLLMKHMLDLITTISSIVYRFFYIFHFFISVLHYRWSYFSVH